MLYFLGRRMYSSPKRWCVVVLLLAVLAAIGAAGTAYGLTLYGIMHGGFGQICTSAGSTSVSAFTDRKY